MGKVDETLKTILDAEVEETPHTDGEFTEEEIRNTIAKYTGSHGKVQLMPIPEKYKNPNFEYYTATTNSQGNIERKLSEGWEIDRHIVPAMRKDGALDGLRATGEDASKVGDTLRFREMVVLRMPKFLYNEKRKRKAESDDMTKNLRQQNEQFTQGAAKGRHYGKITIE